MNSQEFKDAYFLKPCKEMVEKQERAFNAALAYEKNCVLKYDYIDNRPSRLPSKGERIGDFAYRYGTTVEGMKNQWRQVEHVMKMEMEWFKREYDDIVRELAIKFKYEK